MILLLRFFTQTVDPTKMAVASKKKYTRVVTRARAFGCANMQDFLRFLNKLYISGNPKAKNHTSLCQVKLGPSYM